MLISRALPIVGRYTSAHDLLANSVMGLTRLAIHGVQRPTPSFRQRPCQITLHRVNLVQIVRFVEASIVRSDSSELGVLVDIDELDVWVHGGRAIIGIAIARECCMSAYVSVFRRSSVVVHGGHIEFTHSVRIRPRYGNTPPEPNMASLSAAR